MNPFRLLLTKKRTNSLLVNTSWATVLVVVASLIAFFVAPIVINGIGVKMFGLYSIVLMIGGFASLDGLGIGEATLKYTSQYYAQKDIEGINRVIGATLFIYLIAGLIVFIFLEVAAPFIISIFKLSEEQKQLGTTCLRIAGLGFFLNSFGGALKKIPEAIQRYDLASKMQIFMMITKNALLVVFLKLGYGIIAMCLVMVSCSLLEIIFYMFWNKHLIPGLKCHPSRDSQGLNEVFSYGVFSFINTLIQNLAVYMDSIVLGIFFGTTDVGFLKAPKDLLGKVQGLSGAPGRVLFPRFSAMKEGEEMQKLYLFTLWSLTVYSASLFIPIAIIFPDFLSIWLSPEFSKNSANMARLLALGMGFNGAVMSYFAILKGTGRVHWLTRIISSLTIFSIIITFILIYYLGLIGAGIRGLIFSWCGIIICISIGKKIFADFPVKKIFLEAALIPLVIGTGIFFLGCNITEKYPAQNWFSLFLYAGLSLLAIVFTSVVLDLLFFGHKSQATILIHKLIQNKEAKKITKFLKEKFIN